MRTSPARDDASTSRALPSRRNPRRKCFRALSVLIPTGNRNIDASGFTPPNLGARQFVCRTQLLSPDTVLSPLPITRELGWMFRRRHWRDGRAEKMTFFNARLVRGVLDIPPEGEMVRAA